MSLDETQRRKAANEAVFREVNERMEKLQRAFAMVENEPLHIVCECDSLTCAERLAVPVDTYERGRADSACFFITPGHQDESVETVVGESAEYLMVRKRPGEPASVAAETDPRR